MARVIRSQPEGCSYHTDCSTCPFQDCIAPDGRIRDRIGESLRRREKIKRLLRQKKDIKQIAREVKCSPATVQQDIKRIKKERKVNK